MDYLRNLIKKIINEAYIKDESVYEIIGKKTGDLFKGNGIEPISNQTIKYSKFFEGDGTLQAFHSAKAYLKKDDYIVGTLKGDYPIGFIKQGKGKLDPANGDMLVFDKENQLIRMSTAKFDVLSPHTIKILDGVILPTQSNDTGKKGDMLVLFFEFPEN